MKVLLMTPFYSPGVGGSSRLMLDIVEHLQRKGHVPEVLTFALGDPEQIRIFDTAQPYQVQRVAPGSIRGAASIAMLIQAIRLQLRKRFDIVVCGAAFPTAILASMLSLATGVRYAVYSHGEDVTVVEGTRLPFVLLRFALRHAALILANSRFTMAKIVQLGVSHGRLRWLPPGIDPLPYEQVGTEAAAALRNRLGIQRGPVLLTVARLAPRKGHDTVINALPHLATDVPEVQYVVVGRGDPTRLKTLAEHNGVAHRVAFVDYIAEADLPALYALCDVHVMVSRWDLESNEVEGFGIAYLEAGAAGRPSVGGTAGGCADAIDNGRTGILVDPTDHLAVAGALRQLLAKPDTARHMGKDAQQWVREHFERTSLLDRFEALLISRTSLQTSDPNRLTAAQLPPGASQRRHSRPN